MRYAPVHIESGPGRGRTGWYVQDTTVRDCVVTLGMPHMLRIQAQERCDKLNRKPQLLLAQEAASRGEHKTASAMFKSLGIDYIHREVN